MSKSAAFLPALISWALISLACTLGIAPAHAADPLTTEQKAAVESIIHDYLTSHPEVMIEALRAAETKHRADEAGKTAQALRDHREELEADPTSPVAGNPKGDVTIVEFFDFRCPYCKSVTPTLADLLAKDKGVRIVYKDFPILGKDSVFASRVALVADAHGKYLAFHDAAMASKTPLTEDRILDIAQSVGLDPATVKTEMQAPRIDTILKTNMDLARALNIEGTPAFIIAGTLTPGAVELGTLEQLVAAARKNPQPKG
jgi:protein-disulfide isomerase